jgi:hypothetical protein
MDSRCLMSIPRVGSVADEGSSLIHLVVSVSCRVLLAHLTQLSRRWKPMDQVHERTRPFFHLPQSDDSCSMQPRTSSSALPPAMRRVLNSLVGVVGLEPTRAPALNRVAVPIRIIYTPKNLACQKGFEPYHVSRRRVLPIWDLVVRPTLNY